MLLCLFFHLKIVHSRLKSILSLGSWSTSTVSMTQTRLIFTISNAEYIIPNTKYIIPNIKHIIPNTKYMIPKTKKTSWDLEITFSCKWSSSKVPTTKTSFPFTISSWNVEPQVIRISCLEMFFFSFFFVTSHHPLHKFEAPVPEVCRRCHDYYQEFCLVAIHLKLLSMSLLISEPPAIFLFDINLW